MRGGSLALEERFSEALGQVSYGLDRADEVAKTNLFASVDEFNVCSRVDLDPLQNRRKIVRKFCRACLRCLRGPTNPTVSGRRDASGSENSEAVLPFFLRIARRFSECAVLGKMRDRQRAVWKSGRKPTKTAPAGFVRWCHCGPRTDADRHAPPPGGPYPHLATLRLDGQTVS